MHDDGPRRIKIIVILHIEPINADYGKKPLKCMVENVPVVENPG
jgi:hypothetical protein